MAFWKRTPQPELTPQINEEKMREVIVNEILDAVNHGASTDTLRERFSRDTQGLLGDTLHNLYFEYGYPAEPDFYNFLFMQDRFGVAKHVIEYKPDTCWRTPPVIESDAFRDAKKAAQDTAMAGGQAVQDVPLPDFDQALKEIVKNNKLWRRLKGADRRQRIGQYSGLYMRVKDGKKAHEPLEKLTGGVVSLVEIMPLYESQLEVIPGDIEDDAQSERFGLPKFFQFSARAAGSRNPHLSETKRIHWSRIVIVSEESDNGGIYGPPALKACYNALLDLSKISGGAGEGTYRNTAQSVIFEVEDPTKQTAVSIPKLLQLTEQFAIFVRNRFSASMLAMGAKPHVLKSDMMSPKDSFDVNMGVVSASEGIPATIIVGKQEGERASTEDQKTAMTKCQSRRANFNTDMTEDVIDWMIRWGILPVAEYSIEWDDLLALSDIEKVDIAAKLGKLNSDNMMTGGEVVSVNEIREKLDFEPDSTLRVPPDEVDDTLREE